MSDSPWARDWASEQDQREMARFKRQLKTLLAVAVLIALVGVMMNSCVVAAVKTVELQEQYYSAPWQSTLARPAAYRMASPSFQEMDNLEHLRSTNRGKSEWYASK